MKENSEIRFKRLEDSIEALLKRIEKLEKHKCTCNNTSSLSRTLK
jgi:hypothetical protein